MLTLDNLLPGHSGKIVKVQEVGQEDVVSRRLGELGFIPGAVVKILAVGPFGRDPIALRVGASRFALRRSEARRVTMESQDAPRRAPRDKKGAAL